MLDGAGLRRWLLQHKRKWLEERGDTSASALPAWQCVLLLSFIAAKAPFLPLWAETASAVAAVTWLICGHLRDVSAAELGYF